MINLAELGHVFIVCGKTDMRRGIDSLAYIVKKSLHLDLFFLENLPNEPSLLDNQHLEAYLPWSENVQLHCK
jgi:hypothetical protein